MYQKVYGDEVVNRNTVCPKQNMAILSQKEREVVPCLNMTNNYFIR